MSSALAGWARYAVRLGILAAILAGAPPAVAQSRFEIGAGVTWMGGYDAGGADALETRNPATGSSPLTLFDTSSRGEAAPGAAATIGFFVTSRWSIEGFAEYSRPVFRVAIGNDFESATGSAAESRLSSVMFGGSILYHFGARRLVPFVSTGAGWMRQLDEDNVLLVTGATVHGAGGVTYRLDRHVALRAGAGVLAFEKTIAFDERRRIVPHVSGGLTYRF